jgi:hypothetical protein
MLITWNQFPLHTSFISRLGLYANDTNDVNIISRAIKLRGELQAKQDLALKQGNDYYDYITGEVKSNANATPFISPDCVISPW